MRKVYYVHNQRIVTTAQIVTPEQTYRVFGKKFVLAHKKGVCGSNYYVDFGASALPLVVKNFKERGKKIEAVLEAGVGKGVYVTLLGSLPRVKLVWGVDVGPLAIKLAEENLKKNGIKHYKLTLEDIRKTLSKKWKVDLIAHDLPFIPLPSVKVLPPEMREIIGGAGKTGRSFIDYMIKNSYEHLTDGGGLYFVQPDFILGDGQLTRKILKENGFQPILLKRKKKYIDETILTQSLKPYIEKCTGYNFRKDDVGEYFHMQAWLGIKD